jgi:hypothetical protein
MMHMLGELVLLRRLAVAFGDAGEAFLKIGIAERDREIEELKGAVKYARMERDEARAEIARLNADNSGLRGLDTVRFEEIERLKRNAVQQEKEWAQWAAPLRERVKNLRAVVGFFASVIKSGEAWSEQCEAALKSEVIPLQLREDTRPLSEPGPPPHESYDFSQRLEVVPANEGTVNKSEQFKDDVVPYIK